VIRYKLLKIRPQARGAWPSAAHWALTKRFRAATGSRTWDRIICAWRQASPHLAVRLPVNDCEVFSTNLWWSSYFTGGQFGFSHASALSSCGMGCNNSAIYGTITLLPSCLGMKLGFDMASSRKTDSVIITWLQTYCNVGAPCSLTTARPPRLEYSLASLTQMRLNSRVLFSAPPRNSDLSWILVNVGLLFRHLLDNFVLELHRWFSTRG
jgi:hypothetical protein